jgi:hypothetical protein
LSSEFIRKFDKLYGVYTKRAQSTVLTEVLMASAALIVGLSILAYFMSFSSGYSQQVELSSLINYEAANQVVRLVAYDDVNNVVWLLLRKLDATPRNFFVLLSAGNTFLVCGNIYVYNETGDSDGILCNEAKDCPTSCIYGTRSVLARNVIVSTKDGLIPLPDYLRLEIPAGVSLVRIPYPMSKQSQNVILKVELGNIRPENLRVFLCLEYGERFYVVRIYEVGLR